MEKQIKERDSTIEKLRGENKKMEEKMREDKIKE